MRKQFRFFFVVLLVLVIALFCACDDGGDSGTASVDMSKYVGSWESGFSYGTIGPSGYGSGNYENTMSYYELIVTESDGNYACSFIHVVEVLVYEDENGETQITGDSVSSYAEDYANNHSEDLGSGTFSATDNTITISPTAGDPTTYSVEYSNEGGSISMVLTKGSKSYELSKFK